MKNDVHPHLPVGMQRRMLQAGDLLDARGLLLEAGYATAPLKRFDPQTALLAGGILTQWHSYLTINQASAFLISICHRDGAQYESVMLADFERGEGLADLRRTADPHELPLTAGPGVIGAKGKLHEYTLRTEPGRHHLYGHAYDCCKGKEPLLFDLIVEEYPGDNLVLALPGNKGRGFAYTQQLGCLPAEGRCIYGDREYRFAPATSSASLHWGRAMLPRRFTWRRGEAAGYAQGSRVALFLGEGPLDSQAATENTLLVDGRLHKLGAVQWQADTPSGKEEPGAGQCLRDQQGRLDLRFEPRVNLGVKAGSILSPMRRQCALGRFSGTLRPDDGRVLQIADMQGMLETVRWGY